MVHFLVLKKVLKNFPNFDFLTCFDIFKLVLKAHCVQILLAKIKLNSFLDEKNCEISAKFGLDTDGDLAMDFYNSAENDKYENEPELLLIHDFFKYVLDLVVKDYNQKNVFNLGAEQLARLASISPKSISLTLKYSLMPFLRCSALFFSNLVGLVPFIEITNKIGLLLFLSSFCFNT